MHSMSTTIEMTSPSSSIVVVDKSGSAEANNLIQTSASQHHLYHHPHQSHQIHAQQVIVNEEYLSAGDHIVSAGNINYLKTNDLLNNAQIIQSTASFDFGSMRGEAQLISGKTVQQHQHQQHQPKGATTASSVIGGHTQDDQYHGATTVLPQTITNPNSKVHVISNVTLVSKAQQPHHQSISFVNSGKHVHATHPHAVPMTKANASVTAKMINIPYKTASVSHVQQLQPQTQSNQSHVITKHLNNPSAIIQKIPIPRNIHVLSAGRIQHQQQQQQQLHHHISDESVAITHAQIARNTAPSHQTTANVIQIQKQNAIGKSNLNLATVKTAATTTTAAASVAKKHQTVKLINQTTSVVTPQGHQQYTIQSQHVPINHQIKAKPSAQQRVYLTSTYNNDYHYQHAGVQQPNEHANKNGPEYFRVNTSDIQSTTSTFVDNIPLISARTDEASGYQPHGGPNDQDDDIIGEEVRPQPIDSSMDARMRALHALLQDHTYVHLPKKTASANSGTTVEQLTAGQHPVQQQLSVNIMPSQSQHSAQQQPAPVQQLQPHQPQQRHPTTVADSYRRHLPELVSAKQTTVSTTSSASSQAATSPFIPGFPFTYNALAKDDDAHSVISTGSRNNLDIDLGEETETAPEGEGEDDSVTRCICELAHDDGYMICCDKCSVWQHVDCMGIDRQNIPEEYKCELCQPRPVDHNRARTLQLMKRKEQQNFLLMGSGIGTTPLSPSQQQHHQPLALAGQQTVNERSSINDQRSMAGQLAVNEWRHNQLNAFSTIAANKKKGTLNKKGRKDKSESASSSASKRKRSELSASRAASAKQRREAKKSSKRKSASSAVGAAANVTSPSQLPSQTDGSEMSTSSAATVTAASAAATASDKQAANLRTWIENYEAAMTNHYSPELRARLHAMGKQTQSQNNNTIVSMLKHVGTPENKCTTVPHAGGKILISTLDIYPKNPVIEMRGKYMLSTQYQQQQTTATTTTPAAALTVASGTVPSNHTAGPFLFFYRLPNDGPEICVDTRTYGNEARFVRRSCRPNAEILHTIDKGTLHLYIVSLATIKSSTEITIKHEPHDLEWLARGEISAPTSTICACGLIKECPFGGGGSGGTAAPNANPNALPATLSTAAQKKLAKRSNGHIKEMKGKIGRFNHGNRDLASRESSRSSSTSMRKKKSSSSANRNRSRSSSSDQVSKSVLNNATKQLPSNVTNNHGTVPNAIAPVSAEVTSAANALNALASSPKSRAPKTEDAIETSTVVPTALHLKSPEKLNHVVFGVANGTCHVDIDKPSTSPQTIFGQTSPRPVYAQSSIPSDTSNAGDTPTTPDKQSDEKVLKSPPLTPVSSGGNQRVSSATKSLSHKKSARKSTCSLSEDNSSVAGDEFAVSSPNAMWRTQAASNDHNKTSAKPEKAVENKKLTREERKMEAIVRAFEKMEKTEQRKNEQNKKSHPTGSGPNSGGAVGSTSNTSRKRSISSSQKDKMDDEKSTPTKRSSLQQGRRKRKRGKSYSQSNHQRRRRNRHDSQNSEIGTSEDSTAGVSPCFSKFHQNLHTDVNSSDIIPKFGGNIAKHDDLRRPSDVGLLKKSSESDLAADLLLSLSADHSSATSSMSAFPVSSACLLIEAAVGPLGHDFKLPTKAKTKKSIMNDWLHQSDASAAHSPHSDSADQNMLSPNSSYGNVRHDSPCFSKFQISPELTAACEFGRNMAKQSDHSISMAAQKIEEFIQLSTASSSASAAADHIGDDDESSSKWSVSNDVQTVPTPMPTPPLQLGSSVKKRWLRQAISEECSDEMLANSSATSSPPNGFMAPLKKRRVARQCSDMNAADDLPSPVFATSHDASEEKPPFIDRLDIEMNEEESSNAALEAEVSTPIEVDENDADDDSAHVFVNLKTTDPERIEAKPYIETVDEIKSEDIKLEQEEPQAAVEDFIDNQPEEQKIDIKVEIEDEVKAEVEAEAETNADIEIKEDEKVEVEVEEEEEEEEKPKLIPETIDQKPTPMDLVASVDSGSSGSTSVDQIENVERENDHVDNAEKAEIVKIKKIEDTDNNNTEYPNVTALHDVPLPKDEIEDIQQKLHSFHSENLMILQSRNKKRLSRATTPTACDVERVECKVEEPTTNEQVDKTSPSSTPAPSSSTYSPVVTPASKKSIHTAPLNSTAPPLASKATPNAAYGNHWVQRNADGLDIYQQQQTIPPPSFTAIHPHLVGTNASTPYSLYHYLENPNRPTADMAKQKYGKARPEGTSQNHVKSWQNCHPNIPAPTLLNSSNYLTKSYSTLSEPTTPVSAVPAPPVANLASTVARTAQENSTAIVTAQEKSNVMVDAGLGQIDVARRQFGLNQPKMSPAQVNLAGERTGFVLTRTQSADPRLNPPKDLPPVTPKRKLSINEYRKRKQLISGGTSNVGADKVKTPETPTTPEIETTVANANILDAVKPKNGLAVPSETKETVFSPAPTLLELQQESLSQRLKSYKSLHEMSTSKPKDASTENDELNLLRNLEPSSILSSSNSSSLRSSPSLKSFDGESFDAETNEPNRDENIEADDFLTNDIQAKSAICDIPLTKKTATQTTVTSPVTATTPNENDVSEPVAESEPTIRDVDENISATESQASCEPTSAGNISPNENTSR